MLTFLWDEVWKVSRQINSHFVMTKFYGCKHGNYWSNPLPSESSRIFGNMYAYGRFPGKCVSIDLLLVECIRERVCESYGNWGSVLSPHVVCPQTRIVWALQQHFLCINVFNDLTFLLVTNACMLKGFNFAWVKGVLTNVDYRQRTLLCNNYTPFRAVDNYGDF